MCMLVFAGTMDCKSTINYIYPVISVKILELRQFTVEIIDARDGCHVVAKWERVRKYD